jgi:UDP-N-acetylmuramoyl-tripeptide--D-alanyl-D-alanine ligase
MEVYLYGVLGRQYIYPVLAALAIHSLLGNSLNQKINDILRDFRFQAGRMRILDGVKNTIVIDDSYNASPIAVEEALNTLESIKGCKRKIAVLGDMLELGKFSSEAHKSLGKKAASIVDILCTVGFRARGYAEGALLSGMTENNIFQFENALEAGSFIQNIIKEGDVILVKASQTMRLERVVKEIMAEPDKASELLVRQEKEWEIR